MNVVWTDSARDQLQGIYNYIAHISDGYARKTMDRITRASERIASFPLSGRIVAEFEDPHIREITERPYRIIYCIRPDRIDVLAVMHGAQDFGSHHDGP